MEDMLYAPLRKKCLYGLSKSIRTEYGEIRSAR